VSRYAFDVLRRELLVAWGTGRGDVASMVVAIPVDVPDAEALALVNALKRSFAGRLADLHTPGQRRRR
jgi:hypothetical protein